MSATATRTYLPVKTTIDAIKPGDVFDYQHSPSANFRESPVASVENIGGQPVVSDPTTKYPEDMYRVRHEDSDDLGTLYYGSETVWRANRR